jgi:hypothetical protein
LHTHAHQGGGFQPRSFKPPSKRTLQRRAKERREGSGKLLARDLKRQAKDALKGKRPKSRGEGVTISGFWCSSIGELKCKEDGKWISATNFLRYGKNKDGYWNVRTNPLYYLTTSLRLLSLTNQSSPLSYCFLQASDTFKQVEIALKVFEAAHAQWDVPPQGLFIFDNSTMHGTYADDALGVKVLVAKDGGINVPKLKNGYFIKTATAAKARRQGPADGAASMPS